MINDKNNILLKQNNDNNTTINNINNDNNILLSKLSSLEVLIQKYDVEKILLLEQLSDYKNTINDLTPLINDNKTLNTINNSLEIHNNSLNNDLYHYKELNNKLTPLVYEIEQSNIKIQLLEIHNNSLQIDLNDKNNIITKLLILEKDYYQLIDKIKSLEIQNQTLNNDLYQQRDINNKLTPLLYEIDNIKSNINILQIHNNTLQKELNEKRDIIITKLLPLENDNKNINEKLKSLEIHNNSLNNDLYHYKELNNKLTSLLYELDNANNRIQVLEVTNSIQLQELEEKREIIILKLIPLEKTYNDTININKTLQLENIKLTKDLYNNNNELNEKRELLITKLIPLEKDYKELINKSYHLENENITLTNDLNESLEVINNLLPLEEEKVNLITKIEAIEMENKILSKHVLDQKKTIIDLTIFEDDNITLVKELNDSHDNITKLKEYLKHQNDTVTELLPLKNKTEILSKEIYEKSVLIDKLMPLINENDMLKKELYESRQQLNKVMSLDGIDKVISNNDKQSVTPKGKLYTTMSLMSTTTALIERLSSEVYEELNDINTNTADTRSPIIGIRLRNTDKLVTSGNHVINIIKENDQLKVEDPISKFCHDFNFNHQLLDCSKSGSNNDDVIECLGKNAISDIWCGHSHTLIAYGQTNSGKSYSMFGERVKSQISSPMSSSSGSYETATWQHGLVYHIVGSLLHMYQTYSSSNSWEITISCVEIYNEKFRDLFVPDSMQPLKVREIPKDQKKHGTFIENLSTTKINTLIGLGQALSVILRNRKVDSRVSHMASRSHVLVFIDVLKDDKISKLTLVDLAGTTKTLPIGEQGNDMINIETSFIRKSLSVLSRCIKAYETNSNQRKSNKVVIPIRESLLTSSISSIFNRSTNITLLATINPLLSNMNETIATINFAQYINNCWRQTSV